MTRKDLASTGVAGEGKVFFRLHVAEPLDHSGAGEFSFF
jgi:hypothetical protein